MAKYVVTATRNGKRIYSDLYSSREAAQAHLNNTKKNWGKMFKNPRVKKI